MTEWMRIARAEETAGVTEAPGRENNPRIVEYHRTCNTWRNDWGPQQDANDWCSSFVNWVMRQAGHAGTNSAGAISWRNWGQAVDPQYGAVTVVSRTGGHHVGFYVKPAAEGWFYLLGGNQEMDGDNRVCTKLYPQWRLRFCRMPAAWAAGNAV